MSTMEWTDEEREAVTHMSCVNLDCPGPHDRRHGPNGPQVAREKAEKILAALAPFVAAREAQTAAKALREAADEHGVERYIDNGLSAWLRDRADAIEQQP